MKYFIDGGRRNVVHYSDGVYVVNILWAIKRALSGNDKPNLKSGRKSNFFYRTNLN